jgi:hypothetical protein
MVNLQKQGIQMVLRKNATGLIYGITYVDHRNKAVFNGSDLDKSNKQFSAKAILEACRAEPNAETLKTVSLQQPENESFHEIGSSINKERSGTDHSKKQGTEKPGANIPHHDVPAAPGSHTPGMLEILMQNEYTGSELPYELRKTRRKKKRRRKN